MKRALWAVAALALAASAVWADSGSGQDTSWEKHLQPATPFGSQEEAQNAGGRLFAPKPIKPSPVKPVLPPLKPVSPRPRHPKPAAQSATGARGGHFATR